MNMSTTQLVSNISLSLPPSCCPKKGGKKEKGKRLVMDMGSNSGSIFEGSISSGSLNALNLGQKMYFEDHVGDTSINSNGGVSPSMTNFAPLATSPNSQRKGKREQTPRCQVEGCKVDLSGNKSYYRKHKVCEMHSRSPRVAVAGIEQRFCQQCSRFHELHEFDNVKRSCRSRLARHNERRRKSFPSPLPTQYGKLPTSSLYEDNSGIRTNFLMDHLGYRVPSDVHCNPTQNASVLPPCKWYAGFSDSFHARSLLSIQPSIESGPSGRWLADPWGLKSDMHIDDDDRNDQLLGELELALRGNGCYLGPGSMRARNHSGNGMSR